MDGGENSEWPSALYVNSFSDITQRIDEHCGREDITWRSE